jgi:hypothetical protein
MLGWNPSLPAIGADLRGRVGFYPTALAKALR